MRSLSSASFTQNRISTSQNPRTLVQEPNEKTTLNYRGGDGSRFKNCYEKAFILLARAKAASATSLP